MAKLEGILPLRGTIGNLTFSHTKNGIIASQKTSITKERVKTDPAFKRTMENAGEFKTAGKAAKLVFDAFRWSVAKATHQMLFSEILRVTSRTLDGDMIHGRGERSVTGADLNMLEGFNFNIGCRLENVCMFQCTQGGNVISYDGRVSNIGRGFYTKS
jgi:hypothetical protein